MKFLITMNMPSNQGFLVHQITIDHTARSARELCEMLNNDVFIMGRQYYRRKIPGMDPVWQDRGDVIINTSHIGKVAEFIELEKDTDDDEPYGHSENRRSHATGARGPIRPRGTVL